MMVVGGWSSVFFATRVPGAWVAVCRVQARSFLLLDPRGEGGPDRGLGFGTRVVRAARFAGQSRLQWIERVALARDALDDQFAYLNTHRGVGPAAGHYEELLAAGARWGVGA